MADDSDFQTEMQAIHQQVGRWFDAFVGSPQYQPLTEIQREKAPGIIRFFAEYSFSYIGAAPEQWNRGVLEECCLEILPRKMSAELAFFQAVAPVLAAFLDFLASQSWLSNARELSTIVKGFHKQIVTASQDGSNWGPAKAFIMAAERAGVNTCDQQAMSQFLVEHNLRQIVRMEAQQAVLIAPPTYVTALATPFRHAQTKPGRNDPCPCGSGKKYKRCCGA